MGVVTFPFEQSPCVRLMLMIPFNKTNIDVNTQLGEGERSYSTLPDFQGDILLSLS